MHHSNYFNQKTEATFKFNFTCILQTNKISIFIRVKFKVLISTNIFIEWKNIDLKNLQPQKMFQELLSYSILIVLT